MGWIRFPEKSLVKAKNYCRNPCNAKDYTGTTSRTKSGKKCQQWSRQSPHKHDMARFMDNFPEKSLTKASNYCRNPYGNSAPWCYTTDSRKRWEYCNIKKC